MENNRFRCRAAAVAVFDWLLACFWFIALVGYVYKWVLYGDDIVSKATDGIRNRIIHMIRLHDMMKKLQVKGYYVLYLEHPDDPIRVVKTVVWVVIAVATVCVFLKLFTAKLLWKGTRVKTEIGTSIKYCRIWQRMTNVFAVAKVLLMFKFGLSTTTLVLLIASIKDVIFLYFVIYFVDEVRSDRKILRRAEPSPYPSSEYMRSSFTAPETTSAGDGMAQENNPDPDRCPPPTQSSHCTTSKIEQETCCCYG